MKKSRCSKWQGTRDLFLTIKLKKRELKKLESEGQSE